MRDELYKFGYGVVTLALLFIVIDVSSGRVPLLVNETSYLYTSHAVMVDSIMEHLKRRNVMTKVKNEEPHIFVTLTCYNATREQCDENPLLTASGEFINLEELKDGKVKWCAISRDLEKSIPMHSLIHIEGHGNYEVKDRMNKRHTNMIDILQHIDEKGFMKKGVKVKLLRKGR